MNIVGHGIDIVEIARIERLMADHADRFLERCFTPGEREYAQGSKRYAQHIAARFAAKEAALKALGTGLDSGMTWHDVEVIRTARAEPRLLVRNRAAEVANTLGVRAWWVSLSHTESMAMASVIAEA